MTRESMEDLLSKIYDKVAFYEKDSVKLGKEFDRKVGESLEPLKDKKTESEIIYQISYSAEKYGFYIGVRFAAGLLAEIYGSESMKEM